MLRRISLLLTLCFAFESIAQVPCRSSVSQFRDFRNMIHEIAVFGEADRRTEEDYATENKIDLDIVRKRFGATGAIDCNGAKGSAQLTIKNNIITTVAHALKDPNKCITWAKATDCKFTIRSHGRNREIKVKKSFATGFDHVECPHLLADDWAVFQLAEPVDDVEPYQVDPAAIKGVHKNQDVVAVGRSIDFMNGKKHVGNCKIGDTFQYKFKTECDAAEMTSGGSLLNGNMDHPLLLGIFVSSSETEEQLNAALKAGKVNSGPYNGETWRSQTLAIQGDFYSALIAAARQP